MKIEVLFFASAKDIVGSDKAIFILEKKEEQNTDTLKQKIKEKYPKLAPILPSSLLAVNQEYSEENQQLKEGEHIHKITSTNSHIIK